MSKKTQLDDESGMISKLELSGATQEKNLNNIIKSKPLQSNEVRDGLEYTWSTKDKTYKLDRLPSSTKYSPTACKHELDQLLEHQTTFYWDHDKYLWPMRSLHMTKYY